MSALRLTSGKLTPESISTQDILEYLTYFLKKKSQCNKMKCQTKNDSLLFGKYIINGTDKDALCPTPTLSFRSAYIPRHHLRGPHPF